jgi:radical SAM enzyme (TIGR01210 family)
MVEPEPDGTGGLARVLTVFLTNRECPWRCVFCDLWRHTVASPVAVGTIPSQIDQALGDPGLRADPADVLKLYNAGSYFDAGAIPPADDGAVVERARGFRRLVVESHPSLVGDRCWRLRDRLVAGGCGTGAELEVAMGLESVNPLVLERLNKGVRLEDFDRVAGLLRREGVGLRVFVLVGAPFEAAEEAVTGTVRAARHARDLGARVVSLIPVRGGNGALEALAAQGLFRRQRLGVLERAHEGALGLGGSVYLADTWDLKGFADCGVCFGRRRDRLERMNRTQRSEAVEACAACGWGG